MPFLQLSCWESHLPGHKHPCHLPGHTRVPDWKGWQECCETPQNRPHVPRRLRLCLCSSSGCRASSYCLQQQIKRPMKPIKCILDDWIKRKCGAFLLSFSLLLFQHSLVLFWYGLEVAALTDSFLWFISCTEWFSTPVRNITMFSEVSQEYLRGKVT